VSSEEEEARRRKEANRQWGEGKEGTESLKVEGRNRKLGGERKRTGKYEKERRI
jgi:hypothetical protein